MSPSLFVQSPPKRQLVRTVKRESRLGVPEPHHLALAVESPQIGIYQQVHRAKVVAPGVILPLGCINRWREQGHAHLAGVPIRLAQPTLLAWRCWLCCRPNSGSVVVGGLSFVHGESSFSFRDTSRLLIASADEGRMNLVSGSEDLRFET